MSYKLPKLYPWYAIFLHMNLCVPKPNPSYIHNIDFLWFSNATLYDYFELILPQEMNFL